MHWGIFRQPRRATPVVMFDANYWKSFARDRIVAAPGDPGCLSIWVRDPRFHAPIADQWTSEKPILTEGLGRKVEQWELRPNRQNHLWDAVVGSCVAGSILGAQLPGTISPVQKSKKKHKALALL